MSFRKVIKSIGDKVERAEINGEDLDGDLLENSEDEVESKKSSPRDAKKSVAAEELESVKLLYRKLVRRLHPDLQGEQDYWQKQIWSRVQSAYQRENLGELRKIWTLVLMRSRNLNELSMSEIIESQISLQRELERMTLESKGFKKLPAWRFSKRKTFDALERKLGKSLLREFKDLQEKVDEIEQQFRFFELKVQNEEREEVRSSRRPKRRR